jgi:hypothetical protein
LKRVDALKLPISLVVNVTLQQLREISETGVLEFVGRLACGGIFIAAEFDDDLREIADEAWIVGAVSGL